MLVSVFFMIVGFILLIKGADFLVEGSSNIAKKFHIPEIIIGLTIVSIGTSMPELFVSVAASLERHADMAIGNVIGSNACNLLLILGIATVISPVKFQRETRLIEIPMCFVISVIFILFCNTNQEISKIEAIILLILFVLFIGYTILMGIKGEKFDSKDEIKTKELERSKHISIAKNIVYIILGAIGLKLGGDLAVDNAVVIAQHFNLSQKIISLTILSIGTSLPELVTSVTAVVKRNSDIAIGNIIGSNIFNMLLIIGTAALINPISYNMAYNREMIVVILAVILLAIFPLIPPKNEMNRPNGMIYLIAYAMYLVMMFQG